MVRAKRNATEGIASALVKDTTKMVCSYCGGTSFMVSSTMDNPNDVAGDTEFAALLITNAGAQDIQGLVFLCSTCGHEQVHFWYLLDIVAGVAGAAFTMTNLVQATTANLLAGAYCIPLDAAGTDIGKYYIVSTNTAADPTVLTMTVASGDNSETGMMLITNLLPVGLTAAS